ncbi:sulfite exporter TauE/SafE family protein [Natronospira bacteriovora]|uniref:Sulfite exporter TauE/SafE family protein n=1 Tax=Natronospira bacteriovora TaxID=3069753 RepID=A0ABU0WAB9_9GAMM|nr:sulfite exporter TauE/SafE family protein [Natronospira sp. AB-CW4]MDQ2070405.1 sulfite exporter TauE/SafE family protein [Natronospira sp. AB-CW4]
MGAEITLLAAFLAGLAGSAHCLGMCGGIAGALGMAGGAGEHRLRGGINALLYNLGRVGSYMLIGTAAAALVALGGAALSLPHWAGTLRIATALILLAIGFQLAFNWSGLRRIEQLGGRVWQKLAPLARRFLPPRTPLHALALGALWGWLPCGLVYTLVLAAAVSGDPLTGGAIMLAFGLGTLPAMTGTTMMGGQINRLRQTTTFRRTAGALLIGFGLWTAVFPVSHIQGEHEASDHSHAALECHSIDP